MSIRYSATVPSNIALLKYWGKEDVEKQWPANSSISMTLNQLNTITHCSLTVAAASSLRINGVNICEKAQPNHKAWRHLNFLRQRFDRHEPITIESTNSFPTGCGIASSASGLGALTLAILGCWHNADSISSLEAADLSLEQLAHLARLGSGSAGRSFFGGFVEWQKGESADAQRVQRLFPADHWRLADTVAIFSSEEKSVSSTVAHQAAWQSLLFQPRLAGLTERHERIIAALAVRDLKVLGPIIEEEALEMHAVIMTGRPAVTYLSQSSMDFIAWLRTTRREEDLEVFFTIDAGPNIHLLYDSKDRDKVLALLQQQNYTQRFLHDTIGRGPQLTRTERG